MSLLDAEKGVVLNTYAIERAWSGQFKGAPITTMRFSPPGSWLAVGDALGRIMIWSVKEGKLLTCFDNSAGTPSAPGFETVIGGGHNGAILDLCWHPEEFLLASAGADNTVRLWNVDIANNQVGFIASSPVISSPLKGVSFFPHPRIKRKPNAANDEPPPPRLPTTSLLSFSDGNVRTWAIPGLHDSTLHRNSNAEPVGFGFGRLPPLDYFETDWKHCTTAWFGANSMKLTCEVLRDGELVPYRPLQYLMVASAVGSVLQLRGVNPDFLREGHTFTSQPTEFPQTSQATRLAETHVMNVFATPPPKQAVSLTAMARKLDGPSRGESSDGRVEHGFSSHALKASEKRISERQLTSITSAIYKPTRAETPSEPDESTDLTPLPSKSRLVSPADAATRTSSHSSQPFAQHTSTAHSSPTSSFSTPTASQNSHHLQKNGALPGLRDVSGSRESSRDNSRDGTPTFQDAASSSISRLRKSSPKSLKQSLSASNATAADLHSALTGGSGSNKESDDPNPSLRPISCATNVSASTAISERNNPHIYERLSDRRPSLGSSYDDLQHAPHVPKADSRKRSPHVLKNAPAGPSGARETKETMVRDAKELKESREIRDIVEKQEAKEAESRSASPSVVNVSDARDPSLPERKQILGNVMEQVSSVMEQMQKLQEQHLKMKHDQKQGQGKVQSVQAPAQLPSDVTPVLDIDTTTTSTEPQATPHPDTSAGATGLHDSLDDAEYPSFLYEGEGLPPVPGEVALESDKRMAGNVRSALPPHNKLHTSAKSCKDPSASSIPLSPPQTSEHSSDLTPEQQRHSRNFDETTLSWLDFAGPADDTPAQPFSNYSPQKLMWKEPEELGIAGNRAKNRAKVETKTEGASKVPPEVQAKPRSKSKGIRSASTRDKYRAESIPPQVASHEAYPNSELHTAQEAPDLTKASISSHSRDTPQLSSPSEENGTAAQSRNHSDSQQNKENIHKPVTNVTRRKPPIPTQPKRNFAVPSAEEGPKSLFDRLDQSVHVRPSPNASSELDLPFVASRRDVPAELPLSIFLPDNFQVGFRAKKSNNFASTLMQTGSLLRSTLGFQTKANSSQEESEIVGEAATSAQQEHPVPTVSIAASAEKANDTATDKAEGSSSETSHSRPTSSGGAEHHSGRSLPSSRGVLREISSGRESFEAMLSFRRNSLWRVGDVWCKDSFAKCARVLLEVLPSSLASATLSSKNNVLQVLNQLSVGSDFLESLFGLTKVTVPNGEASSEQQFVLPIFSTAIAMDHFSLNFSDSLPLLEICNTILHNSVPIVKSLAPYAADSAQNIPSSLIQCLMILRISTVVLKHVFEQFSPGLVSNIQFLREYHPNFSLKDDINPNDLSDLSLELSQEDRLRRTLSIVMLFDKTRESYQKILPHLRSDVFQSAYVQFKDFISVYTKWRSEQ